MSTPFALRGQTLAFKSDPFEDGPEDAIAFDSDGAVIIADGRIVATGPAHELLPNHPGIGVEHYPGHLIMAGFVDAHIHYPQTGIIASYGAQLMECQKYTPEELESPTHLRATNRGNLRRDPAQRHHHRPVAARRTPAGRCDLRVAAPRLRIAAGKSMMDRNAPPGLLDTPQRAFDESEALIRRWQRDRLTYAVTPRFPVTSTDAQMEAMGTLWKAHPTTLMQTHIAENKAEIELVKRLFPTARDYLDTYERVGLLGPGANFGHAIHLEQREIDRLREPGSGVSHCPTSNLFIGSGLFDLAGLRRTARPVRVGLGTDVGGGSSFSMLATMRSAYEIAQLRGHSLHPLCAFWLATQGSAQVLRMDDRIGNLVPGRDADIVVLTRLTPVIAQRTARAPRADTCSYK
jgi:guanine deaminase